MEVHNNILSHFGIVIMSNNVLYEAFKSKLNIENPIIKVETVSNYVSDILDRITKALEDEEIFQPQSELYNWIIELANLLNDEKDDVYDRIGWLALLAYDLECVKSKSSESFLKVKNDLKKQAHDRRFFDFVAELNTISSLLRDGFNATLRESPDVEIMYENEKLFMEVTQRSLAKGKRVQNLNKIKNAALKKSEKGYANGKTALAIHATDIVKSASDYNDFEDLFRDLKDDGAINFGAVIIFFKLAIENERDSAYDYKAFFRHVILNQCDVKLKDLIHSKYSYFGTDIPR